jgi:tetratricopeptide (TPR) repeat protein
MANTKSAKAARAGKMSKKRRRQERLRAGVALFIVLVLALGIGLGFYLSRGGQTAGDLFTQGEAAAEQGKYAEAIKLYSEGLKLQPKAAQGYILIGDLYKAEFQQTGSSDLRDKEIENYRNAVQLAPTNTTALLDLGQALFDSGAKEEGATYLQKLLELDPNRADRDQIEQLIQQTGL